MQVMPEAMHVRGDRLLTGTTQVLYRLQKMLWMRSLPGVLPWKSDHSVAEEGYATGC